jgi:hypothetical protein
MKKEKPKKGSKVEESPASYLPPMKKNIVVSFSSFEEAAAYEAAYMASLTPLEHLRNATELIQRVFAEDLKKHPKLGTKIYFPNEHSS